MSIRVENLSKFYGEQAALDDISFELNKGEVVGFLGPNGAGKSTTMKIITTYLSPSKGNVFVNGMDVEKDAKKIKEVIGYLPEHNPLYLDLYVKEYLKFMADIYKLPKAMSRVNEIIELVGLQREQRKKIGALSKGYRQRVGLAQSIIHNPEVLILDEPTTGLDPNQIIEIRNLIREIGNTKTVLLSTHIMQEVEAICDRIIVINNGVIVAEGDSESIKNQASDDVEVVYLEFETSVEKTLLEGLKELKQIEKTEKGWLVSAGKNANIRKKLAAFAMENDLLITTIRKEEKTLEDAFKTLTKK